MKNAPDNGPPAATRLPGARRRDLPRATVMAALLVLLTVFSFGRIVSNDFIAWDDQEYVTENSLVLGGLTRESVIRAFTEFRSSNWHPLTWLSHMLDVELFGLRPGGHHLTSLALHTLGAVSLFLVLNAMTGTLVRSALVAALFAVHPLHVQSVAWVAERKDVLSGLLGTLAVGAYLRHARAPRPLRLLAVAILLALGLMAKPMLVTLPLLLFLLDYWPLGRLARPVRLGPALALVVEKAPLLALSAAAAAVTLAAQRSGRAIAGLDVFPLGPRVGNAFLSLMRYLDGTLLPRGLSIFYPHPGTTLSIAVAVLSLLAVAAATSIALLASRRRGYPAVGWLWYLVSLLPVIGVVQVGIQGMADRYTYLPLTGIFVLAAWAGGEIAERRPRLRPALAASASIAVLAFALFARREAGFWKDSVAVAERSIASVGRNIIALTIKGIGLSWAGRLDDAIPPLREAALLSPHEPDLHYNLASTLARRGDAEKAIEEYRTVVRLSPGDAGAHLALGNLLAGRDDAAAAEHLRRAVDLEPGAFLAHQRLSMVLERLGDAEGALRHARRAVEITPRDPRGHTRLGLLLAGQRRYAEALEQLEEVLEVKPSDAGALYNIGRIHDLRGDRAKAIEFYRRSLAAEPAATTHTSLGAALMETGEKDEAVAHFREALRLDPGSFEARVNLMRALAPRRFTRQ